VLGVSDELRTRIPFALAGTLSIFAIYWVKPGKWSACASVFVAVFPLFVWWSRMCRPYAMAGLFMIFAWRYRWCMLPAILCTPVAIVGIDWFGAWKESKKKRSIVVAPIAGLIVMAGVMYLMRGDVGVRPGFGSVQMFLHEPRLWYLPIMAALMYITWYLLPWLEKDGRFYLAEVLTIVAFVALLIQSVEIPSMTHGTVYPWYSNILYYNDWRGMPPVDLATNFNQIPLYYTGKGAILLRKAGPEITADQVALTDESKIYKMLAEKDTILIGVDSYAYNVSDWLFPPNFLSRYRQRLYDGEVFLVRMRRISKQGKFVIEVISKRRML
jgi:hypothetical protein